MIIIKILTIIIIIILIKSNPRDPPSSKIEIPAARTAARPMQNMSANHNWKAATSIGGADYSPKRDQPPPRPTRSRSVSVEAEATPPELHPEHRGASTLK